MATNRDDPATVQSELCKAKENVVFLSSQLKRPNFSVQKKKKKKKKNQTKPKADEIKGFYVASLAILEAIVKLDQFYVCVLFSYTSLSDQVQHFLKNDCRRLGKEYIVARILDYTEAYIECPPSLPSTLILSPMKLEIQLTFEPK